MKFNLKIVIAFVVLLVLHSKYTVANNEPKEKTFIVSGKIIDLNHNELLSGVSINATNCEKTLYSDFKGQFFIYVKVKEGQDFKLEFSQVGYNTKTLTIADLSIKSSYLEINLIEE